ncbi:mechanosensitive ion channel protein 1, mitochondrial-like [Rosa rugosa]|uniref:mechanosensitive ion channel protein 1, mitochondrial-like n=1 Tax=Rosa rugosa TaxID=74645 RepID=UPI002B41677E|nr:mechanosensitive ion channel protein 1, mitochondrial-like [Rosa rugosa]
MGKKISPCNEESLPGSILDFDPQTQRVATAFAARDVLGNVLNGLSMQFTKPFSLGDTIKAGSIEGQVVDMGLTTTSLLNAEKFPVIVPNSLFSSQVIVNKSRAQWRGVVTRIPLQINDDLDKVPQISDDIKSMLRSHPKVFLGKEVPYCFLSRLESSFGEQMSKDELFSTEEDILLRSIKIIKRHGAKLGSTYDGHLHEKERLKCCLRNALAKNRMVAFLLVDNPQNP